MKFGTCLLILFCLLICTLPVAAQRWLWGQHISYTPFVVNSCGGYLASDKAGNVYTAACLGTYSSNDNMELGGVTSSFGALSITDSISDSFSLGQVIITKFDPNGAPQWLIGTQRCDAGITNMVTDRKGNLYVLGVYDGNCTFGNYSMTIPPGKYDNDDGMYFLAKISPAGSVLWARNIFATASEEGVVQDFDERYYFENLSPYGSVGLDSSGNCYVAGVFIDSTVTVDGITLYNADPTGSTFDMFIAKFDTSGATVWARQFGTPRNDWPLGQAVTGDGYMYFAGMYVDSSISFGSAGLANATGYGDFITRIDNNGNVLWATSSDSFGRITSLAADTAGNAYVSGFYSTNSINFGTGALVNYAPNSYHTDLFVASYNSAGSPLWAVDGGGPAAAYPWSVTTDQCGHVFVSGDIQSDSSSTIFFKGTGLFVPASVTYPTFIAAFSNGGDFLNGQSLPDGGTQTGIVADNNGNLLLGGQWTTGSFSFGPDNFAPDSGESFMFVAKLQYDSAGCLPYVGEGIPPVIVQSADILLYPNPAHTQVNIASVNQTIGTVAIVNVIGQTVKKFSSVSNRPPQSGSLVGQGADVVQINVADLPSGIYFVKINETEIRKFVKE